MGQAKRRKELGTTSKKIRFLNLLRKISKKYSEFQMRKLADNRKL